MKKIFFLTILLALINLCLFSQTVNIKDALIVANNAFNERLDSYEFSNSDKYQYTVKNHHTVKYDNMDAYHIINYNPKGFIIISAQKSFYPVLGFSSESSFNHKKMHPSIEWWMDNYAKHIAFNKSERIDSYLTEWERLLNSNENFKRNHNIKTTTPLIKTKWDQGLYYNAFCPEDPAGPDGRAVVGCVAVAIGQIFKYFGHPEVGTGSYSYHHEEYGELEVDFSQQHYNYDHMPVSPTDYNDDMAKLLYHIGVSVDMNYGPHGSGMWNHKGAYTMYTYFDYHPETQYLFRDSLSEDFDWNGTLIDHLDQKIPLYYAGWSDTTYVMGHAFVFDAYSDSTHFHINWGWGGSYDGFFYLENLKPGGSDFTLLHEVIVNAIPANPQNNCDDEIKELTTYEGIIDDGSGPIQNYLNNMECSWLINPQDSANGIKLEFLKFNLDYNDEIIIFNGPNTESPVLQSYTGSDTPTPIESNSDQVLVKFITDDDSVANGWLLSYKGIKPKYCNLITTLTDDSGIISDGSNNYQYQNNTFCTWKIKPEDAENIKITFLEFDTEPINDYVQILDENNQAIATFSGSMLPEPIIVEGGEASIVWRTNSSIRGGGFKCQYETNVGNISKLNELKGIKIFPNPANEFINLDVSNLTGDIYIRLINNLGQEVKKYKDINQNQVKLCLSDVKNGLYIIEISVNAGIYRSKVIVSH